ncbi:hypothetical protein KC19_10G020600 [Ceratodon purpureus]|uniref:F-box domain-containing protein n=1 Tax=Ceratodon purpureus TaxID=3225 RepID=A0A8T0GJJ2_CERPU|nr:hypothetical protein KC19_10G020600 [Ceratodon purpureus]
MGPSSSYQLAVSGSAQELTMEHLQSPCSLCELVSVVLEMERIMRGRGVSADLQVYLLHARQILLKARQLSQSQLGDMVKHMRKLRDILVFETPFLERPLTAREAGLEAQRTTYSDPCCTWLRVDLRKLTVGTKRGFWETATFPQNFYHYCGSTIAEGPSKRPCKKFGCLRITARQRQGESGDGGCNPAQKDVDGEERHDLAHVISASSCYRDEAQYICKDNVEEVNSVPSLDSLHSNEVGNSLVPGILKSILGVLCILPGLRWLSKKKRTEKKRAIVTPIRAIVPKDQAGSWDTLPNDLQDNVLHRLGLEDLFRFKTVSKSSKELIESEAFGKSQAATLSPKTLFTAINYYIQDKAWRCSGFDLESKTWRVLPPFSPTLPAPDPELFKEYSVCGHGGLMCADISKSSQKGKLVVFNPLTMKRFALPPLLNPRSPVLVHLWVDSETKSYKVIAAGSSTASDEHLSKKIEVFDSKTSMWYDAPDLPGPAFGLNEHQAGVCVDGILYLIAFLEGDCRRGVLAFDVKKKKWLDTSCPIPFSMYSNTLQLVETRGQVYLFSEQEQGGPVEHCIDLLELPKPNAGAMEKYQWKNVVRVKRSGGRGLQVYPEHTCVSFGDGKLCIFNTLTRDGVVYDMQDGKQLEVLQPPPVKQKGDNFFSLNPTLFTLQPSFDNDPIPPILHT